MPVEALKMVPEQVKLGVSVATTSSRQLTAVGSVAPSTHASPSSAHASVQLWPPSPMTHV